MSIVDRLRRWVGPPRARTTGPNRVIHCAVVPFDARPPIVPTLGDALGAEKTYVPAALIAQKAKTVSDGILATLERLATEGGEAHLGVLAWLEAMERELDGGGPEPSIDVDSAARERIAAALEVGRTGTTRRAIAQPVLTDPERSRPIGFYSWSEDLARVFVRDRFLQETLPSADARAMAAALHRNAILREAYAHRLHSVARITDRLATAGVDSAVREPAGDRALFPPSVALEDRFGGGLRFFDAVKTGQCDLTPHADSGFYAHQRFALVPLLMPHQTPEAACRTIDAEYARALERLAGLGHLFARETHVKQIGLRLTAERQARPRPVVFPRLTVEPVPSYYRRTADAFRFLRGVVEESWGATGLSAPQARATGAIARTVADGIDEVVAVCDAAAELSTRELDGAVDEARDASLRARLRGLRSDDDAVGDARAMVPVSKADDRTGRLLALVFVGWEAHRLELRLTHLQDAPRDVRFGVEEHVLPLPVVREVTIEPDALLDRDAFRRACDRWAEAGT